MSPLDESPPAGGRLPAVVAIAVAAVTLLVWAWSVHAARDYFGTDSAIYTMQGIRLAAGDATPIWNGCAAPGAAMLVSLFALAGASHLVAFRAAALVGHLALLGAVAFFAFAVAHSQGAERRRALIASLLVAGLFGLAQDVASHGAVPLTDQPALAAILTGLALAARPPASGRAALAIGAAAALAYLFRYVFLSLGLMLLGVTTLRLLWSWWRAGFSQRAPLARLALLWAPVLVSLGVVIVGLSDRGYGFAYGANVQPRANIYFVTLHDANKHREARLPPTINPDGTVGYSRVPIDHPDSWNEYHWVCRAAHLDPKSASDRARARLGAFTATLSEARGFLWEATRPHGPWIVLLGGIAWLALLVRSLRRRAGLFLWLASAGAATTVLGGFLIYFGATRYLWLPILICLCGWSWVLAEALPRWAARLLGAGRARWLAPLLGAVVIGAWTFHAAWGLRWEGTLARLLRASSAPGLSEASAIAALLEPARREAEAARAAGAPPFSTPAVASRKVGYVFGTGARPTALPALVVPDATWEGMSREQREALAEQLFSTLRRGRVRYALIHEAQNEWGPLYRELLRPGRLRLPDWVEVLGDVPGAAPEARAARAFRVKDR